MQKKERLNWIMKEIDDKGIVYTSYIIETLKVSDMTARRDLDELEKSGKLIRFHGGAQSMNYSMDHELSHLEKSTVHVSEKKRIAMYAASLIEDKDTVFIGPGTTCEVLASLLTNREVRVVTNSLPVFRQFSDKGKENCILVAGSYRARTGTFVGGLANTLMQSLKCTIAFFSCNGISNDEISTSSVAEGEIQNIALNDSRKRWLLADASKFNHQDFYVFYHLYNLDGVITDSSLPEATLEHYRQYTQIIEAPEPPANSES